MSTRGERLLSLLKGSPKGLSREQALRLIVETIYPRNPEDPEDLWTLLGMATVAHWWSPELSVAMEPGVSAEVVGRLLLRLPWCRPLRARGPHAIELPDQRRQDIRRWWQAQDPVRFCRWRTAAQHALRQAEASARNEGDLFLETVFRLEVHYLDVTTETDLDVWKRSVSIDPTRGEEAHRLAWLDRDLRQERNGDASM